MPVVDFALSLDRTRFEPDHHVGKRIAQDRDPDFTSLAGRAK
ncbi:hypothetical protein [Burkholderia cenocepacia]|nr:hypothetical protein [Burkholderia cenocepacia]